jgi:hypothetical protein
VTHHLPARVRTRARALLGAAALALCVAAPATAAELLEVIPSEEEAGVLNLGLRDGADVQPTVIANDVGLDFKVDSRKASLRWQPLVMMVDNTNISEERLDKIKQNVRAITTREFAGGSQWVVVGDESGGKLTMQQGDSAAQSISSVLDGWKAKPAESPKKEQWSPVAMRLKQVVAPPQVSRGKPWALIFSSMCVAPDEAVPDMTGFRGPLRFLTWSRDLPKGCEASRTRFFEELAKTATIEVLDIDDPAQADAVKKARAGRGDVLDEEIVLSGIPYDGGALSLAVSAGGEPWTGAYSKESIPPEWARKAIVDRQAVTRRGLVIGFIVFVVLVLIGVIVRARTAGAEINKWEAVGEAEDLSAEMDPDAWNATIFQLTGAMPVLKEVREAAQLGPAKTESNNDGPSTVASKGPLTDELKDEIPEGSGATQGIKPSTPATEASTGMTVAMPVLDDGTGYDANTPFEIGVLLDGKPVARKTKKFRKVFSIGRATDNRVVIQKDDTVHRYHVVVRPALQGKEWWLEVSPTATNRTNLNGKDLRAGGRYRLPDRFRLQLGEATEVRGRLSGD